MCSLATLSVVLTLLPVLIPFEGLLLTTVAPVPLIVLAVKYPWRYALGLIGIEAGVLLGVGGLQTLLFFSQQGIMPIVIASAVRRGYSLSRTIGSSVLVPLGMASVLFAAYSFITHRPLALLLTDLLDQTLRAVQAYVQTSEQAPAGEMEQLPALSATFPGVVLALFPAILVINHLFTNVLNYVLARFYCARSRPPLRLDAETLTCWRASDYLVWVFLASGTALLLPFSVISTLGGNVFLVTLAIYLLQGLAIAVFWGQRLPFPPGVRWLLALMILMIAGPLSVVVCIATGLFDLWVDFRRLRRRPLSP
jgi:hypothetical protein